ncbi:serine O-acetyltransferase [Croceibacterium ferulae]|uniref:serine O-acetyltransferase n=1 Tax=Croceibacterium ferulae TaxID=1854641 RepID=UPI000EB0ABD2|nr:serine acetyltransferase [Croceibacterium ferulae]
MTQAALRQPIALAEPAAHEPDASIAHSTLDADMHRRLCRAGAGTLLRLFLTDRAFRPLVTLRLFHRLRGTRIGRLVHPLLAVAHKLLCQMAAIDLPMKTAIGPGLAIMHGWSLVVSHGAVIGRNVTLFHGVTIGQGDRIDADGRRVTAYPVIEDDVWIGPGAVIVGDVRIGAGSRIMAHAIVIEDVPPRSMVAAGGARIVRENCTPDVLNPAPLPNRARA